MQLIGIPEAAKVAGVTENAVYIWLSQKKLAKVKDGKRIAVDVEALKAFLATRTRGKGGAPRKPAEAAAGKPGAAAGKPAGKPRAVGKGRGPLTVNEAAALANVTASAVYFWMQKKLFPTVKKGNARLIPRAKFARFLKKYPGNPLAASRDARAAAPAEASPLNGAGDYLTLQQAASEAQIVVSTVHRWAKERRFPTIKQGHRRMIPRAAFAEYLATYAGNPKARREPAFPPPGAVRLLARDQERAEQFGTTRPRADLLAPGDLAHQIGTELGSALANYRKHVLRDFLRAQLALLDADAP